MSAVKLEEEEGRKGRENTFKNYYTKFFGGKLLLEHLHPPTHTIFSTILFRLLNWCPVYQKKFTCVTKNFEM
jgi:hypothetical protein